MAKTKTAKTTRSVTRNHTKRHGRHHKRSTSYVKTYAPYLPLLVSIIASVFLSMWQPQQSNTLAYATNTSINGLLESTNVQRRSYGRRNLVNNSKLNQAAQSKAQDMVARNYWSHNTPDGKEPWVFIDATGYAYNKAGENLAYGFTNSTDTITGWMNSPTHKANLLDSSFSQVGFGFANSANFNGDGQQTVVVAMYGSPMTLAASTPNTTAPTAQATPTAPTKTAPRKTTPVAVTQKEPSKVSNASEVQETAENPLANTEEALSNSFAINSIQQTKEISRIGMLTGGDAPWAIGAIVFLSIFIIFLFFIRYSLKLRHLIHDLIHDTEKFVMRHALLDSILVGLLILGVTLSRTAGSIL